MVQKTLKTNKDKDLKILEQKTKSKDNDKGSRSNITKHEGTSLQQDKDQNKDSRTKRQSNLNKTKEVWKPKNVGSKERLASPKPSKPRMRLRLLLPSRSYGINGSHLNFDTINDLARNNLVTGSNTIKNIFVPPVSKEKSKRASHPPRPVPNSRQRLHLLHMDLCGPIRIASINGKQALYYPKNDREDIGKLGAKGLDLTYASSTITTQRPTECELDLLFEAMHDESYYCGITVKAAPRLFQLLKHSSSLDSKGNTTTSDPASTPTNSSSQATSIPRTSQNVDELETKQQQHVQHQPAIIADNVPNAMFDDNLFVNPFVAPSTSAAGSSSSQYVDPSNMHKFYQP
ncbi:hypothetical protein Tco_0878470 [Tanacetum coccineum]|uniref:Uncharacterized protein n=1 Tax=Tanacetum coccineum TaxID=301880 RepID=A0ABQ5C3V3_9ASTR